MMGEVEVGQKVTMLRLSLPHLPRGLLFAGMDHGRNEKYYDTIIVLVEIASIERVCWW